MKIGNSEVWLKGFLLTIALNISINDITHAIMQHHPDDCYWSDVRALLNNLWLVKFARRSWGRECPNIPFYFTSPVKISRVISRSISLNYRHGWKLAEPKRTSENPDTKRIRNETYPQRFLTHFTIFQRWSPISTLPSTNSSLFSSSPPLSLPPRFSFLAQATVSLRFFFFFCSPPPDLIE